MSRFFVNYEDGRVATQRQLIEAGIAEPSGRAPAPWHRIRGAGDASTLWYAVLIRSERGIVIGTLCLRHSPHHALLLDRGWSEVAVPDIRVDGPRMPTS